MKRTLLSPIFPSSRMTNYCNVSGEVRNPAAARQSAKDHEETMDRRNFLLALAAAPLSSHLVAHAQPRQMKDIEALQKNWKTLLPAGASVPAPSEALKLAK